MGKDNNVFRVVRPAEGVDMAEADSGGGMRLVPLNEIKVGDRHRRELGDVASLANSIDDLGLLQPIVVTPHLELVSGLRRIRAVESLGHDSIEAYIVHGLDEAATRLRAERDENTCRKAFTPTEEHALYEALMELERPMAEERRMGNLLQGDTPSGKVSHSGMPAGRAREQAAIGASGKPGRHKTLEKVGEVKAAFSHPDTPEPVRKVAEHALREMDATGRVDGGYQKVKDAERAAIAPKPNPAVEEFVNDSKKVQDASYVHEFMRAFARSGDWLRYDPQRVSELIDDSEFSLLHRHIASAERFVKAVTSARRGLRLISGGEK